MTTIPAILPAEPLALSVLPVEIWRKIMLSCPQNYCALALTCRDFHVDIKVAKKAMTRAVREIASITYVLPCGCQHRDDDLPAQIYDCGTQIWYRDGKLHRDNNPTIIWWDSDRWWYNNGIRILN